MANVKVAVLEVDGIEYEYPTERVLSAIDTQFSPGSSGIVATNVEDAIKEVRADVESLTKSIVFADYAGGTANTGRYLEWYKGISSLDAPLEAVNTINVLNIVLRTTATTATCTVGFYNVSNPASPVLLYTLTMSGVKKVTVSGSPLFSVPAGAALGMKINSGSITKPHMQVIIRSA